MALDLTAAKAALTYAARGWPVLPLHNPTPAGCSCERPDCAHPAKHPRTRRGLRDATTTARVIRTWWTRWPDANVAIATGTLIVVDVDGPAGHQALHELARDHGRLPTTLRARTARGQHLYFHAAGNDIGCSAGQLAPGLDVRGRGGYAIAPPSRHPSGHTYEWTHRHPIAPIPDWLAKLLSAPAQSSRTALPFAADEPSAFRARRYLDAALAGELTQVLAALEGTRNHALNRAAFRLGQLAGAGLATLDELAEPLLKAALDAGLAQNEAIATITSGLNAGARQPRPCATTPSSTTR